jgi:hypothetical protein
MFGVRVIYRKIRYFLIAFKLEFYGQDFFKKKSPHEMSRKSVQWELFRAVRGTDRQIDT